MNVTLPKPAGAYSYDNEVEARRLIEAAFAEAQSRQADITLQPGQRIVMTDEDTGAAYRIKLASGVLSAEAL